MFRSSCATTALTSVAYFSLCSWNSVCVVYFTTHIHLYKLNWNICKHDINVTLDYHSNHVSWAASSSRWDPLGRGLTYWICSTVRTLGILSLLFTEKISISQEIFVFTYIIQPFKNFTWYLFWHRGLYVTRQQLFCLKTIPFIELFYSNRRGLDKPSHFFFQSTAAHLRNIWHCTIEMAV